MEPFVTGVGVLAGLSAACAVVLTVAYRYLRVEEDPRLEVLDDLLPGNNCGACGEPGCHAFAEKLLGQQVTPGQCTVSGPDALAQIAEFLGVDVGGGPKVVARLKCAGGSGKVGELAPYRGVSSCRAAALVNGGGRACTWGCLGLADCANACTFDVIHMNADGLPVVDTTGCTACNDCVEVCPLDLFELLPLDDHLFVQCNSPLSGVLARSICRVACDACGRCAADAPAAVTMVGGLPVIDRQAAVPPTAAATWRCPTGAIQWLDGDQFQPAPEWVPERSAYG